MYTLEHETERGRRGTLTTPHGDVKTPFFLPVATAGAMKGIGLTDLEHLGAQALLCNTYHLHLSPSENVVKEAGGLHAFIGWNKPILTDSGGFQVFSLRNISTITDDGVTFRDHKSGRARHIGPEEAMAIQHALGADIIMCFDECPPSTAPRAAILRAVDRTLRWARTCKHLHEAFCESLPVEKRPLLFGIVQGGLEPDLRIKCAEELQAIGFDGYAIGGLAVGESEEDMLSMVTAVCPHLPKDRARYLMGVGDLAQIRKTVALGIDMFDCVAPMREARHGNIWLSDGTKIRIKRSEYLHDHSPLDADSPSPLGRKHLRSYVSHLLRTKERYGETIACMQNIGVTLSCMKQLRG